MSQNSRDTLLDAAYRQYWVKGYSGTSVDSILKDAKLPKGSFYYFFKSKKAIAIATIEERIIPKMKDLFTPDKEDDPVDALFHTIRKIASVENLLMLGCPLNKLIRELLPQDDADLNEALIEGYREIQLIVAEQLKLAMDTGFIQNKDADELANFILSTTWGSLSLGEKPVAKESFLASVETLHEYFNFLRIQKTA